MVITIARINRKKAISKKTGKEYEQLGIAPIEDTLMDINGDSFARDGRWLSGFGKSGVTDNWIEGDQVKVNLVRVKGKKADQSEAEFINFQLPVGVDPMVKKFTTTDEVSSVDPDDF